MKKLFLLLLLLPAVSHGYFYAPSSSGGLQDKKTVARLSADSTHKNSDGAIALTDLNVPVAASTNYMIDCYISYTSAAQAVIVIKNDYPASFVFADYGPTGPNEVLAICQTRTPANGTSCVQFLNVTNNYPGSTHFYLNFKNGVNAGTVAFKWLAGSTGDADVTMYAGSFCEYRVIP